MALLLALFIAVPILELYVIIEVGGAIGVLPTLALLLATAILGSMLLRQQGRDAWRRFQAALAQRRFPAREVADGLMIAVGGALLLTPGFVTDAVGLALLFPPTRAVARRLLRGFVTRRFVVVGAGPPPGGDPHGGNPYGARGPEPPHRDYDFEGTAEEVDEEDAPSLSRRAQRDE